MEMAGCPICSCGNKMEHDRNSFAVELVNIGIPLPTKLLTLSEANNEILLDTLVNYVTKPEYLVYSLLKISITNQVLQMSSYLQ